MSRSGRSLVFGRMLQHSAHRAWFALALALSFTVPARAGNDANGDDPRLEAPIQQGIALRKAGNDEAALALFAELEQNNPDSVRVLLHATAAAQATGRWMLAYTYLQKALTHKHDPYFVRYRGAIKNIEDATAQHVGQFRAVGDPIGAEVRLNGELVGTLPMPEAKPIEVGQYVLEVTKVGFYPLRRTVSVAPAGALTQESVTLRVGTAASAVAGGPNDAYSAAGGAQPGAEQAWWRERWVTWTLGGITLVTAGTSLGALIHRNNRADLWNSNECLNGTMTREEVCGEVHDEISVAQNVAIGTGIAALVFGGATITQAILSNQRPPVASASAKANGPSLQCGPGLGSISCFGSF
jgi:hypothetical protein